MAELAGVVGVAELAGLCLTAAVVQLYRGLGSVWSRWFLLDKLNTLGHECTSLLQ